VARMKTWALPEINLDLCSRCGKCAVQCPTHAVAMVEDQPSIVRPADCNYCADCESVCPEGAITCTFEIVWGESGS
jgi:MinD superfamily P-loop ATPase